METNKKINPLIVSVTGVMALAGLLFASVGALYLAGMFGISAALATQIVSAVEIGGWALAVVFAALTGGIAGLGIATVRAAIARYGSTIAAT